MTSFNGRMSAFTNRIKALSYFLIFFLKTVGMSNIEKKIPRLEKQSYRKKKHIYNALKNISAFDNAAYVKCTFR